MAWIDVRYSGWPDTFRVTISAYEHPGGSAIDLDVDLGLMKGSDEATLVGLYADAQGQAVRAEVRSGQVWRSEQVDFSQLSRDGFNTLLFSFLDNGQVRTIKRTLYSQSAPQVRQNQPAAQRARQQPKPTISANSIELEKCDGGKAYNVVLTGIITVGDQPLKQAQLDFYYNGRLESDCQLTPGCKSDDNGRFSFTFEGKPAKGERVKLEVQIRGGISRNFEVDIPAAPKEEKKEPLRAVTLKANLFFSTPAGDKMRHTVIFSCQDQHAKPIAGGEILWAAGSQNGTLSDTLTPLRLDVDADVVLNALLTGYGIQLDHPLKLSGPNKEVVVPKAYAVEAELDSPHPVGGKFIVVGSVTADGKLADCACVVSSAPENCVVEGRLGIVMLGLDRNTYTLSTRAGKFKLAVSAAFAGEYCELAITAPDGTTATVPMVRPRR